MTATIRPRKWAEFQHYKDRCPPWVKLHRGLLDDYKYSRLPLASKAIAPLLWLLASEAKNGDIPFDSDALAFRLHITRPELDQGLTPLIKSGFFECSDDASMMLAACNQSAIPETEAEGEAKRELEVEAKREAKVRKASPSESGQTWQSYSEAYQNRYGTPPVRNATVNTQLSNFVKRVGIDEAPAIAAFYVGHNSSFYVGRMHAVGNLLADAEKLRTEWATGRKVTQTKARQIDQTASNGFLEILEDRKRAQEIINAQ